MPNFAELVLELELAPREPEQTVEGLHHADATNRDGLVDGLLAALREAFELFVAPDVRHVALVELDDDRTALGVEVVLLEVRLASRKAA